MKKWRNEEWRTKNAKTKNAKTRNKGEVRDKSKMTKNQKIKKWEKSMQSQNRKNLKLQKLKTESGKTEDKRQQCNIWTFDQLNFLLTFGILLALYGTRISSSSSFGLVFVFFAFWCFCVFVFFVFLFFLCFCVLFCVFVLWLVCWVVGCCCWWWCALVWCMCVCVCEKSVAVLPGQLQAHTAAAMVAVVDGRTTTLGTRKSTVDTRTSTATVLGNFATVVEVGGLLEKGASTAHRTRTLRRTANCTLYTAAANCLLSLLTMCLLCWLATDQRSPVSMDTSWASSARPPHFYLAWSV